MPVARINGRLIVFFHIPKCGGETTEKYLQSVSEAQSPPSLMRPPDRSLLPCSPQHLHGAALRHLFRPKFFDYGFAIIRDPVARIISEYRFRAEPRRAKAQRVPEFPDWWRRTRQRYACNPFILDNHIRPQAEFVAPELARRFDVFHFEQGLLANLEMVFEALDVPFVDLGIHTHRAAGIPVTLNRATFDSIISFYDVDIKAFGFSVDVLRDRHLSA